MTARKKRQMFDDATRALVHAELDEMLDAHRERRAADPARVNPKVYSVVDTPPSGGPR